MSVTILTGDAETMLSTLPDQSVQCVVTSPPYFALRDYAIAGQIGLESTLAEYLDRLVGVFREVRRVLASDGVLWLNIGDSYASGPMSQSEQLGIRSGTTLNGRRGHVDNVLESQRRAPIQNGLKPKDLMMVPARLALALQVDGWYLRSDIIWAKPNPMPESVTDRPTSAHEHIFLLSKSARYYYDADAIADLSIRAGEVVSYDGTQKNSSSGDGTNDRRTLIGNGAPRDIEVKATRNARNVWTVATVGFPGAHFATFPPEIPRRCILAGTSEKGQCPACGKPWVRVTEKQIELTSGSGKAGNVPNGKYHGTEQAESGSYDIRMGPSVSSVTTGWQPSCHCDAGDPVPQTVLDPFGGAGTVGLVADRLDRNAILIELNPEYVAMARDRIYNDAPMFAEVLA